MRGFGSLWRYMKHCLIAFVSDDGGFSLFSPDFPEFSSQGDCLEEAVDMATDCLRLLVDVYGKEGRPLPEPCELERAKAHTEALLAGLAKVGFVPDCAVSYHSVPTIGS